MKFPNERQLKEKLDAEAVISKLWGNPDIADCRRLGPFDTQKKRPFLVSFKLVWDKRKCLALAIQKNVSNQQKSDCTRALTGNYPNENFGKKIPVDK